MEGWQRLLWDVVVLGIREDEIHTGKKVEIVPGLVVAVADELARLRAEIDRLKAERRRLFDWIASVDHGDHDTATRTQAIARATGILEGEAEDEPSEGVDEALAEHDRRQGDREDRQ